MQEYNFVLVIAGDPNSDGNLNALFDAGCDDATFGAIDGAAFGEFTREAESFSAAVTSAIQQVESVPGLKVLRIEPDDLVTASEIAERLEVTRQEVHLLVTGARQKGKGTFPSPVSHLTSRNRLWSWAEIASWYEPNSPCALQALWIAKTNRTLALWRESTLMLDETLRILDLSVPAPTLVHAYPAQPFQVPEEGNYLRLIPTMSGKIANKSQVLAMIRNYARTVVYRETPGFGGSDDEATWVNTPDILN